jgi:hypothetical protein
MLTVKIIEPTAVNARPAYLGDVIEVSDRDGHLLVALGKAEVVRAPAVADDVETAVDTRADEALDEAQRRTRPRRGRE